MKTSKLKLAIFDLTDCEGCELQFLALREKLAEAGHDLFIANWRLVTAHNEPGPYDITFIEGSPITETDIEIVKQARRVSKKIISLGTCANLGGIQASLPASQRSKNLKDIYGAKYIEKTKAPKPLSYYIDVDISLPGCPVSPIELERLLVCLFANKKFIPAYAPVCFDCKVAGNACLFLDEGFCLGPVTKGGCGAPCPKAGLRCYGCFGPINGANLAALPKAAPHLEEKNINKSLELFMKESDEYKEYRTRPKGRKK
jgi:sulfhydrogenase subunit delta